MKKFLRLSTVFALLLTLQACGNNNAIPDNTTLQSNADCLCEFRVPNDWTMTDQYEKADLEYTAPSQIEQVIVFHGDVPEGQQADFNAYVQQTLKGIQESTEVYKELSNRSFTLNGLQARQFEIETVSQSQPITNLLTIVEGTNGKLYQILAWSVSSNYGNSVKGLHAIVNTFKARAQ